MSNDSDDKFFEVLAGKRGSDDDDTRRAARLRQYFDMHPTVDAQSRHDPQGEAQLIAFLRARAATSAGEQRKPATAVPETGPLRQLMHWLFPAGGGRRLGYGMAAAAVLGAVVIFRVMQPGDDDSGTMKSLPPIPNPPRSGSPDSRAAELVVIRAMDPAQAAAAAQGALASAGVPTVLQPQGSDLLLSADVPATQREAAAQALVALGLALPADGRLRVRFALTR